MKKTLFIATLALLISTVVSASEYTLMYRGARPMGMGGAFTAVSDDENALFYNPAGLNRIKPGEGKIVVLNPQIVLNTSAMNVIGQIKDKMTKNPIDALTPYIGQNMHVGVMPSMPFWVRHDFALALMLPTLSNDTQLRRNVAVQAIENIVMDSGLMFGFAHGFLQDRLSIGANVKFLVRGAGHVTFDAVQLYTKKNFDFKDIGGYGFGVDGDLGAMYTFNKIGFVVPTVALTINNIAATKFPTHFGGGANAYVLSDNFRLKRSVGLGSKFEMPSAWHFSKWIIAFDVNNIGQEGTFFKKVHLGTEAWLFNFFGLRGGVNQGYLTFGLALNIPVIQIEFFTYGEELGESAGSRGDRRVGLQLSFGW
jgi:hypothetical protein